MLPDSLPDWLQRHRWAVGNLIRDHRKAAGLSQQGLAERAGIDNKTISRAENGVYAVSIDQLARIACALGVSSSELLPGRGEAG